MTLRSPYELPFQTMYSQDLGASTRDIIIRIHQAQIVSVDAAEAFDSIVIPFLLMMTSGAMAGESIPPWTSTVESWEGPVMQGSTLEWSLTSVTCDPQAWVMLAQMLQIDHKDHAIARIDILDPVRSQPMLEVATGISRINPYPNRWAGIRFPIDFYSDLPKSFTVYVEFSQHLSEEDKERIHEECGAWAPGLIIGAYGVAPVPPDKCTGYPDEEIVFVDNALEWSFNRFKAHTGAIEGLINVLASISQKIVQVTQVRVD